MQKFQFKIGQKVSFFPEDGVLHSGKIKSVYAWTGGHKKGGEQRPTKLGYTVEEDDGTLWSIGEKELLATDENVG